LLRTWSTTSDGKRRLLLAKWVWRAIKKGKAETPNLKVITMKGVRAVFFP
jgi:hypothetical protein